MSTTTASTSKYAGSKYILRPDDMESYSPANHTGTKNTRLVSAAINGAQYMEVVLGEVEKGAGVSNHAHPGMEQAQYFIGESCELGPGDSCFFPADVFHSVRVTSERMKVLIIYSPPYGENPEKVVRK